MLVLGLNFASEPFSMAILEFSDTSEPPSSLTLHDAKACIEFTFKGPHAIAENAQDELDAMLSKLHYTLPDISTIAVITGPGSYTGLRIGVTMAKTLAQTLNIPIYGLNALEAQLYPYRGITGLFFSLLPARKNEYNIQLFSIKDKIISSITDPFSLPSDALTAKLAQFKEPIYIAGKWASQLTQSLNPTLIHPLPCHLSAAHIAFQGVLNTIAQQPTHFKTLIPHYSHAAL